MKLGNILSLTAELLHTIQSVMHEAVIRIHTKDNGVLEYDGREYALCIDAYLDGFTVKFEPLHPHLPMIYYESEDLVAPYLTAVQYRTQGV